MADPYLIYPDVLNMMNARETDGSDQSSLMSTHLPDFTDRLLRPGGGPDIDAKCCNVYSLKAGLKENRTSSCIHLCSSPPKPYSLD